MLLTRPCPEDSDVTLEIVGEGLDVKDILDARHEIADE